MVNTGKVSLRVCLRTILDKSEASEDVKELKRRSALLYFQMKGLQIRTLALRLFYMDFGSIFCNLQPLSIECFGKEQIQSMFEQSCSTIDRPRQVRRLSNKKSGQSHRRLRKRTERRPQLHYQALTKIFAILVLATFVTPLVALDHELVPMGSLVIADAISSFTATNGGGQSATPTSVLHPEYVPGLAMGTCTAFILLVGGHLVGAARSLLGPLMGITSVLWFIMRNDAAVKPSLSWTVFGAWSIFTLIYLSLQCRRVTYHTLYVLLSLVFAGLCLCVVATVQRASIQGGLVTAIPPCTSFAAYAVAFVFPSRSRQHQLEAV